MKNKKTQRKPPVKPKVRGRAATKPTTKRKPRLAKARVVKASYDAALPADLDEDHWYWADSLNANAANSRDVRKTLRERAQYECDNNGYCGGLVDRLANDLVGTGPRPQLRIPGATRDSVRLIELAFVAWSRRVSLPLKLRLLDQGATVRGEGFALLATNPALPPTGVQLDLRLYETDQVETPWYDTGDPLAFDGGRLDEFGNVVEWHFLKAHPGSDVWGFSSLEYDAIPASRVLHWYKPKRAGQLRGVPEILSSLTLYAYLRRYTLATVQAAETHASIAGALETENVNPDPSEDTGSSGITMMDKVPIPRGTLLTMPAGWKARPFDSTQPNTNYPQFKGELLTESGAAVGAPRNVATNSSAEYNYSSGRLDRGIYEGGIKVRRGDFRAAVLDRILSAWLSEARLVPGLVPAELGNVEAWTWDWFFDAFPSVDPAKDATLNDLCLKNGSKTYAEIYAEKGMDWEEALEQQGLEQKRRTELGLPPLVPGPAAAPASAPPVPEDDDAPEVDEDEIEDTVTAVLARLLAYSPDQPRDDDGKFGEGGGGGGGGSSDSGSSGGKSGGSSSGGGSSHAEKASNARKEAESFREKARDARKRGDHEEAAIHQRAAKAQDEVADKAEALDRAEKAKKDAESPDSAATKIKDAAKPHLDDLTKKAEDARKHADEVKKKNAGAAERLADLKEKLRQSKERQKKLKSSRAATVAAAVAAALKAVGLKAYDPDQPRDEEGQWGEGGAGGDSGDKAGSKSSGGSSHESHDDAKSEAHEREDAAIEKARDRELADHEKRDEAEDRKTEREREQEDAAIEKAREKEDARRARSEAKEDAELDRAEERERREKGIDKQEDAMFDRQGAEAKALAEKHAGERKAAETELLQKVERGELKPHEAEEQMNKVVDRHISERAELDRKHFAEEDAFHERHKTDAEKRREEVHRQREADEGDRIDRRIAVDNEREARREAEDAARETQRDERRTALEKRWADEDDERESRR